MFKPKIAGAVALLLLTCTAAVFYRDKSRAAVSVDTIYLLLPDSEPANNVLVQVWLDAAAEEGLHLQVVRDSALLDPMFQTKSAGLIVPDQVHREANDALIGALHRYVEQGGKLMFVYDACTWDLGGRYAQHSSRLSDLAGVDYALYDRFGTESITSGKVWGTNSAMQRLTVPPGAYVSEQTRSDSSPLRRVALHNGTPRTDDRQVLVGYLYGELEYPSFQTAGEYQGKTLLQSATGLIAGEKRHGPGDVLFVNLPLGYLVTRTDGMLLHSFLRYFALEMLHEPYLANVPDGVGGLVMNWHIDAESALKPMAVLRKAGVFDHGPFSADFTAGPDVNEFHDGKGLNLQNSSEARSWVHFLRENGDDVGSHGGWIHNYFGRNLSDKNEDSFKQYLALNKKSIESVSEQPVDEYSAPMGNQPAWVTRWLENNGVHSYYFAGDAGMGPTRVYRDRGRDGDHIWAFPILHFGQDACLEEMKTDSVSPGRVGKWLADVTEFVSNSHLVRLVYSHPIGAIGYLNVLRSWFAENEKLAAAGQFRWYTMAQMAKFLNARQEVAWNIERRGSGLQLTARHPRTLAHQTWMFPDREYARPEVADGSANVRDDDGYWIVSANDCKRLKLNIAEQRKQDGESEAGN